MKTLIILNFVTRELWKFNFNKENFGTRTSGTRTSAKFKTLPKLKKLKKVPNFAEVEEVKKVPNFAEVEEVKKKFQTLPKLKK